MDEIVADHITDALMEQILTDFVHDKQKMEVEDKIDEGEYEDKWPYNLEAKMAQAEEERL